MSSSSGVKVNQECVTVFNDELKLGKKTKYVIFKLSDDRKEIVVDKKAPSDSGKSTEEMHEQFVADLPENDCRYAAYDFEYDSGEGKRNKIFFVYWASDNAGIKSKMTYSTSKDAIRKALNGIGAEMQATDFDEVAHSTFLDKVKK
jgi:cofilin